MCAGYIFFKTKAVQTQNNACISLCIEIDAYRCMHTKHIYYVYVQMSMYCKTCKSVNRSHPPQHIPVSTGCQLPVFPDMEMDDNSRFGYVTSLPLEWFQRGRQVGAALRVPRWKPMGPSALLADVFFLQYQHVLKHGNF